MSLFRSVCVRGEGDHKDWLLHSGSERLQCVFVNTPHTSLHTHTLAHIVVIGNMCFYMLSPKTFSCLTQHVVRPERLTDHGSDFYGADWTDLLRKGGGKARRAVV